MQIDKSMAKSSVFLSTAGKVAESFQKLKTPLRCLAASNTSIRFTLVTGLWQIPNLHGQDLELVDRRRRRQGGTDWLHSPHQWYLRVRGRGLRGAHGWGDLQDARPAYKAKHLRHRSKHRNYGNRGTVLILTYIRCLCIFLIMKFINVLYFYACVFFV